MSLKKKQKGTCEKKSVKEKILLNFAQNFAHVCKRLQTKPGYIPKEDIVRELKEIEENLNELERRGVELELRLRKSEEGEPATPRMHVWRGM